MSVLTPPFTATGLRPVAPSPAQQNPRPMKWTREEFMRVHSLLTCQGKKVQLIRGEIWEFEPMRPPHASGISKCRRQLERAFPENADVRVQLPIDLTLDTMTLPDGAVVPLRTDDYATAHPTGSDTMLLVEVADTSLQHDLTEKAELYATAGVREYWVVDVLNRELYVLRDPGPLAANGTAYRDQRTLGPEECVAPLAAPDRSVKVADLLP